jgi:hypothetical protein
MQTHPPSASVAVPDVADRDERLDLRVDGTPARLHLRSVGPFPSGRPVPRFRSMRRKTYELKVSSRPSARAAATTGGDRSSPNVWTYGYHVGPSWRSMGVSVGTGAMMPKWIVAGAERCFTVPSTYGRKGW